MHRYLPESPRWLMSQGRFAEVKSIMKTCAKINGKEFPEHLLPQLEVKALFRLTSWYDKNYNFCNSPRNFLVQRKMTENRNSSLSRQSTPKEHRKVVGVMSLFRTPNMRLKTILITFNWYKQSAKLFDCWFVNSTFYVSWHSGLQTTQFMSVWVTTDRWWVPMNIFRSFSPDWWRFRAISFVGLLWIVGEDVGHSAC